MYRGPIQGRERKGRDSNSFITPCLRLFMAMSLVLIFSVILFYFKQIENNSSNSKYQSMAIFNESISMIGDEKIMGNCDANIDFNAWAMNSPDPSMFSLLESHIFTRHGARFMDYPDPCFVDQSRIYTCASLGLVSQHKRKTSQKTGPVFEIKHAWGDEVVPESNCMIGQLLKEGFSQHIRHGKEMYRRYTKLYLKSDLFKSIRLRADNYLRTQESVQAFYEGMDLMRIQDEEINDIQDDLKGAVISISTEDLEFDPLGGPNSDLCHSLTNISNEMIHSKEWVDFSEKKTNPLILKINPLMVTPNDPMDFVNPFDKLFRIWDCMTVHACHSKWSLPDELKENEEIYRAVETNMTWFQSYMNEFPSHERASQIQMGPLMKLLLNRLKKAVKKGENGNVYVYGTHDTTIMPILGVFKVDFKNEWPPYASMMVFELFKKIDDGKMYVQTSYNGIISSDRGFMEWDDFKKYLTPLLPNQNECIDPRK